MFNVGDVVWFKEGVVDNWLNKKMKVISITPEYYKATLMETISNTWQKGDNYQIRLTDERICRVYDKKNHWPNWF